MAISEHNGKQECIQVLLLMDDGTDGLRQLNFIIWGIIEPSDYQDSHLELILIMGL